MRLTNELFLSQLRVMREVFEWTAFHRAVRLVDELIEELEKV